MYRLYFRLYIEYQVLAFLKIHLIKAKVQTIYLKKHRIRMKIIFNSMFLLGMLAYIGAGTVPIWNCLKENKFTLTHHCIEKEEVSTCCSTDAATSTQPTLNETCCELIDQPWISKLKNSFEQNEDLEKNTVLAFKVFSFDFDYDSSPTSNKALKDSPTRGSPPLYKIHSSYLC